MSRMWKKYLTMKMLSLLINQILKPAKRVVTKIGCNQSEKSMTCSYCSASAAKCQPSWSSINLLSFVGISVTMTTQVELEIYVDQQTCKYEREKHIVIYGMIHRSSNVIKSSVLKLAVILYGHRINQIIQCYMVINIIISINW